MEKTYEIVIQPIEMPYYTFTVKANNEEEAKVMIMSVFDHPEQVEITKCEETTPSLIDQEPPTKSIN